MISEGSRDKLVNYILKYIKLENIEIEILKCNNISQNNFFSVLFIK